jgi:hypothetical protein
MYGSPSPLEGNEKSPLFYFDSAFSQEGKKMENQRQKRDPEFNSG